LSFTQFLYVIGLVVMTLLLKNSDFIPVSNKTLSIVDGLTDEYPTISPSSKPDYLLACFVMAHCIVWVIVACFDRSECWLC